MSTAQLTAKDRDPTLPQEPAADPPELDSGKFAVGLRWAGAFAVAASAVVYMLQGLNNIDLDMRNWVYLGLMALLGACGVASQKFLQDAKGTRVFFGLAALLVPVQFSQLGGLIHDLVTVLGASVPNIGWLIAGTLAVAIPVAYAAISVLARADRRALVPALLLLSGFLLLPGRASVSGFVVLAGIVLATMLLELRVLRSNSSYQSLEGRGVRLLMAVPMIIATVRMSLHVDSVTGFAAMGGIAALILSRISVRSQALRAAAAFLGSASWYCYALVSFPNLVDGVYWVSLVCLPIALWMLDLGRLAKTAGAPFRTIASALIVISAGSLLIEGGVWLSLLALVMGALTLGLGVLRNYRAPALAGVLIVIMALFCLLISSLSSVEVNSWIALGLVGVVLVFSASVLEKFGRRAA